MKPEHWGPNGPTLLYLHGGGYGVGSPGTHRDLVGRLASQSQVRCVSLDYRLAPEHPFPAAVDDAVSAYRALIDEGVSPAHLTMGGDSAGGGLTLATLQRLRDSGDPLPAAILLLSPWVDLTCQGESILDNADRCYLSRAVLNTFASHYHQDLDPECPLISPLYADLRGFPPMLILTGDAEALYSENLALAARAREHGVDVTLHVGEGMVHVWPALTTFLAEGRPAMTAMADFLRPYSH
jgi:acetyl esterase/lipase